MRTQLKSTSSTLLDKLVIASMDIDKAVRSKSSRREKMDKLIDNKMLQQEIDRLPMTNKQLFELQVAEQVISEFQQKLARAKTKRSYFLKSKHDIFTSISTKRKPIALTVKKYTGGPRTVLKSLEKPAHIVVSAAIMIQKHVRGFIARKKLARADKKYRVIYNRCSRRALSSSSPEKRLSRIRTSLRVDEKTYMKHQMLFEIVLSNDLKRLQLMSHNFGSQDVNLKDKFGNPPLYYSAKQGNLMISRFLVSLGARLSDNCENGNTVLHAAFISDNSDLVYFFLTKGADLNKTNKSGKTPLAFSSSKMKATLGIEMGKSADAASILSRLRSKKKRSTSPVRSIEYRYSRAHLEYSAQANTGASTRHPSIYQEEKVPKNPSHTKRFHSQTLHLD